MALTKQQRDQMELRKREEDRRKIEQRSNAATKAVADRAGAELAPVYRAEAGTPALRTNPEPGQVISIPLSLIDDNPYNARVIYIAEELQELAASIATKGLEQPIKVIKNPNNQDRFISVYGHRRRMACKIAGKTEIAAILDTKLLTNVELYLTSDRENSLHSPQGFLDDAHVWKRLLDDNLFSSYSDLAETIGKSKSVVVKTVAVMSLPQQILDIMKESPKSFGLAHAYELSILQASYPEKAIALAKRMVREQLTVAEVESARRALGSQNDRKKKEISRQYKLTPIGAIRKGVIKDWDSGRVSMDVTVSDPAQRMELVEKIKALFPAINGEAS